RPARRLLGRTLGREVWNVLERDDLHDARLHWFEVGERPNWSLTDCSLSRCRLLELARLDLRASCRAALIKLGEPPLRIGMHDVVRLPRVRLRPRPAMGGNVENDARKVGVFDLVAVGIVRVAHDPGGASVAHNLALFDDVVDPEAKMVDANEVLARTLRRRIGLELQEGKIHDAIGQEHTFGERAVELRYLLEPECLLIELRGLPRVLNAECDMADTTFRLLRHWEPPVGCGQRTSVGL